MMNDRSRTEVVKTLRAAASTLLEGMAYNPDDPDHRQELAAKLRAGLEAIGFKLSNRRRKDKRTARGRGASELIFSFYHRKDPGLSITVYSSISPDGSVRSKGADAIRVCTEYETKALRENKDEGAFSTERLIFKRKLDPRKELAGCTIHRVGKSVDIIVKRAVDQARKAYAALNVVKRCNSCSAPVALSKRHKEYCTETCWK